MAQNKFTNQFMSELQILNIDGSIIKEIEEHTADIPSINEFNESIRQMRNANPRTRR